jgi:hypothetical protein
MANRNFNKKQALEKEVKDIYAKFTVGTIVAPTISLATTVPVVLTKSTIGSVGNGGTVTIQVAPAAANPTDTILANVTGTAAAITVTITPNDGTNNAATPVPLTTAELAELLDTGSVTGKTVTVTDGSSLLANIASATGGDTTDLADGGEGDGVSGTWAGGADAITDNSVAGIASVSRNGVGDYSIVLEEAFYSLKNAKVMIVSTSAQDLHAQIKSESVATSSSKTVRVLLLTGASAADPAASSSVLVKFELKNSSVGGA